MHTIKEAKPSKVLEMGEVFSKFKSKMSLVDIKKDLTALVKEKNCGPILIRLSWHDAGVYSTGKASFSFRG